MSSPAGEDILSWLDTVIGTHEQVARAAEAINPSPWTAGPNEDASVAHIALHGPESVLRRCTADRQLMELHRPQQDGSGFPDSMQCRTCCQDGGDGYQYLVPAPCPTIRALAEGYGWTGGA